MIVCRTSYEISNFTYFYWLALLCTVSTNLPSQESKQVDPSYALLNFSASERQAPTARMRAEGGSGLVTDHDLDVMDVVNNVHEALDRDPLPLLRGIACVASTRCVSDAEGNAGRHCSYHLLRLAPVTNGAGSCRRSRK